MKELLNTGQVLGRSEMKKIMAGSGGNCNSICNPIAQACFAAVCYGACGSTHVCTRQLECCQAQCRGTNC